MKDTKFAEKLVIEATLRGIVKLQDCEDPVELKNSLNSIAKRMVDLANYVYDSNITVVEDTTEVVKQSVFDFVFEEIQADERWQQYTNRNWAKADIEQLIELKDNYDISFATLADMLHRTEGSCRAAYARYKKKTQKSA